MEANKILSADVLDLVFEGRNKDYGAYDLRKTYNRRILRALIITASVALLALLGSILSSVMKEKGDNKVKINEMTIQDIKQEEKKPPPVVPPPPPPPKQEPPKVEMKQFTPPVIKKDEEVEKPPPPQTELKEAKIDVVNQEGVKDEGIAMPVQVIDQGKQIVKRRKKTPMRIKSLTKLKLKLVSLVEIVNGVSTWKGIVTGK